MKRVLSILLVLSVIWIVSPIARSSQEKEFAGGCGTVDDPYLIANKEHLDHVRFYPYSSFRLVADITFADGDFAPGGAFYNGGAGWEPIGYSADSFCGNFDGNDHRITNLQIKRNRDYVGLFGTVDRATIHDLTLLDASIEGTNCVGGVAGRSVWAHITHCFTDGIVKGDFAVGGVVGYASQPTKISQCKASGEVRGSVSVGGICGYVDPYIDRKNNTDAKITACYNTAAVFGDTAVGGIAGEIYTTYAWEKMQTNAGTVGDINGVLWYSPKTVEIKNCYNVGNIQATGEYTGGILGKSTEEAGPYYNTSRNIHTSSVKYCYNAGKIYAAAATKGNIAGNAVKVMFAGCCYLEDCVTGKQTTYGAAKSHNQMQTAASFEGWDFTDVWTFEGDPVYVYPELRGAQFFGAHNATDAVIAVGSCGADLTWELSGNGVLMIKGTGAMQDFYYVFETTETDVPWIAFAKNVRKIQIYPGVTTIGKWAFRGMDSLTEVEIPDTVVQIGNSAFWLCSALPEIHIPASVHTIGGSAFYKCTALTHLELPEGITSISPKLCYQNTALEQITIPGTVTQVGDDAFRGCAKLQNVYYSGQKSDWKAITIGANNKPLSQATLYAGVRPGESVIVTHPKAVTANAGTSVQFYVETDGDVSAYRWQYQKRSSWHDTKMAGYDTHTLTVDVTANRNGYQYRCVVTFADGTVRYSNAALLTVVQLQGD